MIDSFDSEKDVRLWECVHDGSLESLVSDTLARTVTLVVDVPYLWNFHGMPDSTRFVIELQGVRRITALQFSAWSGAESVPSGVSWEESEKIRQESFKKGRYESLQWSSLASVLEKPNNFEFSDATICSAKTQPVLSCDLRNFDTEEYPTVEIAADRISYKLGFTNELSQQEFLALGQAYWSAFAERSAQLQQKN